jgi:hypothetical protein
MKSMVQKSAIAGFICLLAAGTGHAQSITDSGNPTLLLVSAAVAGSQPTPVVNNSTTYRARTTNNGGPQKITGRINSNMAAGLTLTIELQPTTGATSLGPVTLSTTTRDLLTNLTNTANETRTITYTFSATVAAGVVAAASKTVTLTIIDWP